ncbi:MAG: TonB protein [Ignavibacteria bacterium]|nr:MAG: TonB protein [Ignavibacteria bacterium]KAF0161307.1 MAG: TonB protein [Ignavibacteria bacterium]
MKHKAKNNVYGFFELKRIYPKNYSIGVAGAVVIHLVIIVFYFLSFPKVEEKKSSAKLQIVTYVDLGPPPSIIPDQQTDAVSSAKSTFGNLKIAKKGEETSEFEIPNTSSPVENIKVEEAKLAEKKPEPVDETYYVAVDIMPEPFGGLEKLQQNVNYPEEAKKESIVGRVLVKAFVNENGEVTRTEIVKGLGYGCDEEAMWVVKNARFRPGKKNGKPIKVQITIPISFKQ